MRQVPHYLIIGNGRVARHIQYYFSLLTIPFSTWHRQLPLATLKAAHAEASHILLLINDQAIDTFIEQHHLTTSLCMHFSGSLMSRYAIGVHPLMSFASELYDLSLYQSIPFIVDEEAPPFSTLFPALPNQHVRLPKSLKAKYHALCVLSGNFSCMLWAKLFESFEKEFHFPPTLAHPYLLQLTRNLINNYKTTLTGPLVRGDQATIQQNLAALHADPFQSVYQCFVSCYQQLQEEMV